MAYMECMGVESRLRQSFSLDGASPVGFCTGHPFSTGETGREEFMSNGQWIDWKEWFVWGRIPVQWCKHCFFGKPVGDFGLLV